MLLIWHIFSSKPNTAYKKIIVTLLCVVCFVNVSKLKRSAACWLFCFVALDLACMSALQCAQQQTEESSGRGSDGDCGCPTGQSVQSKSPRPPGWDETWQSPQILQETEGRERRRRGEDETAESQCIFMGKDTLSWTDMNVVRIEMVWSDEMWR